MKKTLLILILVAISFTLVNAISIETETGTDTITFKLKEMEMVFNKTKGTLLSLTDTPLNSSNLVYIYGDDGYDVFDSEENVLLPTGYSLDEDDYGNFFLEFKYEDGTKTYLIKNDPYYTFDIIFNFSKQIKVSLPFISYENYYIGNGYFASYAKVKGQKTLFMTVSSDGSGVFGNKYFESSGRARISTYAGPMKLVYIENGIGNYYEEAKQILSQAGALTIFSWIHHGIVVFLYWLYELTGSLGWAIILFTVVVKILLYPLQHMQTKSMINMRTLAPEIEKIKHKYKDPKKQQEETAKLYKEKGINPAGGCLPLLVQFPIIILLYNVIQYFSEMFAYSPFLFWQDLSTGGFVQNLPLILVSLLTGILMAPITAQDVKSARTSIAMSMIFPIMFFSFPTGLMIYWAAQSLIQLLLTNFVYKKYNVKGIPLKEVFGIKSKKETKKKNSRRKR